MAKSAEAKHEELMEVLNEIRDNVVEINEKLDNEEDTEEEEDQEEKED